ncbi:MAG: DEAD/DEAH box helicase, partial [Terriglobales bacterium]
AVALAEAGTSAEALRKLLAKEGSVGELLAKNWELVRELKPAFLLTPQSVGLYLPRTESFDLLVVDEASQVRLLEMAGALARARQVVVVGDAAQLPPHRRDDGGAIAGPSLYQQAVARLPKRALARHYRARHESLMAFANQHLYGGKLSLAPSPADAATPGVRAEYLPKAIYSEQRNLIEAARVVELLLAEAGAESRRTVGVVALTPAQRDLTADLLEHRLSTDPAAAAWCQQLHDAGQPLFVRALEDAQGEERDLIVLSTVFGKSGTSAGVRQNFGVLGRTEGAAALNVMLTRARHELVVVTSLQPDEIVRDEETPRVVVLFRDFLE